MRKKAFCLLRISFLALTLLTLSNPVKAQLVSLDNPFRATSVEALIADSVDFVFNLALVLAPLMAIIAGFLFVTSGGDPKKTDRAKQLILWTAIGFLIVLLARGIITMIKEVVGG